MGALRRDRRLNVVGAELVAGEVLLICSASHPDALSHCGVGRHVSRRSQIEVTECVIACFSQGAMINEPTGELALIYLAHSSLGLDELVVIVEVVTDHPHDPLVEPLT